MVMHKKHTLGLIWLLNAHFLGQEHLFQINKFCTGPAAMLGLSAEVGGRSFLPASITLQPNRPESIAQPQ